MSGPVDQPSGPVRLADELVSRPAIWRGSWLDPRKCLHENGHKIWQCPQNGYSQKWLQTPHDQNVHTALPKCLQAMSKTSTCYAHNCYTPFRLFYTKPFTITYTKTSTISKVIHYLLLLWSLVTHSANTITSNRSKLQPTTIIDCRLQFILILGTTQFSTE